MAASDTKIDDMAQDMFYRAYPVEGYRDNPDQFWQWFKAEHPDVSRDELEAVVAECESQFPQPAEQEKS